MNSSTRATAVGVFVFIGLLCIAYMTVKLGKMELFASDGFELTARFTNISGLRVGADVEMAGIPVGRVQSIALHRTETDTLAVVTMRFDRDLKLRRPHRRQVHCRHPWRLPRHPAPRRRDQRY